MELTEETGVNKPREYKLTQEEKARLIKGIQAFTIIGSGDINGYHWEDIFSYVKSIPKAKNGMQLYDIINIEEKIGWSAKTVAINFNEIIPGSTIVVNIQHSDILTYSTNLSRESSVELLGEALLHNWNINKIQKSSNLKNIVSPRLCMLVRSKNRNKFAYYESDLEVYSASEIAWSWVDETKMRLVGVRITDGVTKYAWNPNHGHFYEYFTLPMNLEVFSITPNIITTEELINSLVKEKPAKLSFKQSLVFWYKNIVGRISSLMNTVTAKVVAA